MTLALPASLRQMTEASPIPFQCMQKTGCLGCKATLQLACDTCKQDLPLGMAIVGISPLSNRQMGNTHISIPAKESDRGHLVQGLY